MWHVLCLRIYVFWHCTWPSQHFRSFHLFLLHTWDSGFKNIDWRAWLPPQTKRSVSRANPIKQASVPRHNSSSGIFLTMCVVYHVDTTMDRKHLDRMKNRRHLNNRWKRAATCFCKLAVDRLSHAAYRSLPTPIRIPEHSSRRSGQRRLLFTQPHVTPKHDQHRGTSLRSLYFPITVSHHSDSPLLIVPL